MQVQWWGSEAGRLRAIADGHHVPKSRAAFFGTSDMVSLHVRLKPETLGIVTAGDWAAMAPRSLLVNTSRSGLIAEGVLEAQIALGRIHAAVDVFDTEPLRDTAPQDPNSQSESAALVSSGRSSVGRCPASSTMQRSDPGINSCINSCR